MMGMGADGSTMDRSALLPGSAARLLLRIDFLTNLLKVEYLLGLFTRQLNGEVLDELESYYGRQVQLVGGMNEAFRWFLGCRDVECVQALADGSPYACSLVPRQGQGNLFIDPDPRVEEHCRELDELSSGLAAIFDASASPAERVVLMAEFLAIKVTCHDLFIHGRGEQASGDLFTRGYVGIQPAAEREYMQQMLESPPDAFRMKNVLAYMMAHGIDPLSCLIGSGSRLQAFRASTLAGMRGMLERAGELEGRSFFTWDTYGMCNFVEGPIFLRKNMNLRCVWALEDAWERHDWDRSESCTRASASLTGQVFDVLYDHSIWISSGSPGYFIHPEHRRQHCARLESVRADLDSRRSVLQDS